MLALREWRKIRCVFCKCQGTHRYCLCLCTRNCIANLQQRKELAGFKWSSDTEAGVEAIYVIRPVSVVWHHPPFKVSPYCIFGISNFSDRFGFQTELTHCLVQLQHMFKENPQSMWFTMIMKDGLCLRISCSPLSASLLLEPWLLCTSSSLLLRGRLFSPVCTLQPSSGGGRSAVVLVMGSHTGSANRQRRVVLVATGLKPITRDAMATAALCIEKRCSVQRALRSLINETFADWQTATKVWSFPATLIYCF